MPSIPRPPRLEAPGGVVLRPLRGRDAGPFAAAFRADPGLAAAIGAEADPTPALVRRLIAGQAIARARGARVDLAIAVPDAAFAGSAGLHGFAWAQRRAEVGIWLVPAARGRGVGAAALDRLAQWALGELGLQSLQLTTTPENRAARALAARAGFAETGLLRADPERGRRVDLVLHARLAVPG
jgi:[ribosomal protein S5]-alanine N-acetyltransferase